MSKFGEMNHAEAVDFDATALAGAAGMFAAITGKDPATLLEERYAADPQGFNDMVQEHYAETTGGSPLPTGTEQEVYDAAMAKLKQ